MPSSQMYAGGPVLASAPLELVAVDLADAEVEAPDEADWAAEDPVCADGLEPTVADTDWDAPDPPDPPDAGAAVVAVVDGAVVVVVDALLA